MALFTVEFTESVHRNLQIEAADEQETTDWVNENWEEACNLDPRPQVSCDVNHCYPAG